ncbi:type I 3-dehydroquinase-domain-containing protein [Xylaria bambusicola]|uniref:type I 3-dehydroquinase-domain-containing protein n=1 Tax=Xylaria bambusicola TaxID=326684 RepID=UPI0020077BF3|nr:type I 3-dehydroquinase-domain-containing protein [Xylaria bambusicola]KAI0506679.1 type I 3-dehydroquinase-domain-containing protein [Xylaria bambusicola]
MAYTVVAGVKRRYVSTPTHDERQPSSIYAELDYLQRPSQHDVSPQESRRGMSLPSTTRNTPPRSSLEASFEPDASIVLVGIRGSGKSTLAIIASTAMKRRVVDLDVTFKETTGLSAVAYKKEHGLIECRRRQYSVLETVLASHQRDCIIVFSWMEPGLHAPLEKFSASHPIIHIARDPEAIQQYLRLADETKIRELMKYTASAFRAVANFEFFNVSERYPKSNGSGEPLVRGDGSATPPPYLTLKRAERHFLKFLSLIMPSRSIPFIESAFPLAAVPTETREFTYAVSVPLSRLLADEWETKDIETGADAIEIVIDDVFARNEEPCHSNSQLSSERLSQISKAVGSVRRNVVIPIIYHVPWPTAHSIDDTQRAAYVEHVQHGLLLCAEYITVDLRLDDRTLRRITEWRKTSKIIGSVQFESSSHSPSWADPTWMSYYHRAQSFSCDLAKFTRPAFSIEDNFEINMFRSAVASTGQLQTPLIAYNTGAKGRHSACLNKVLTSVLPESVTGCNPQESHEYPGIIVPSISCRQATLALQACFATDDALKLYVVGANCQHSLSPAMHNTAIQALGTGHVYRPYSTNSLSDIRDLIHDPSFAGASVGLPFKVEVISLTHSLSNHAKAIGAVNTLIPIRQLNPDGSIPEDAILSNTRKSAGPVLALYGENTDWIGIRACIRRGLSPANAVRSNTAGLVIGAGGMARAAVYSMLQLGVQNIVVYNRSPENTQKLVSHFERLLSRNDIPLLSKVDDGKTNFHILRSRDEPWPAHLRQPTIVVSCIPAQQTGNDPPPNFTLPEAWMGSPTGGVVVDFSYKILNTPIILQTRAEAHRGWVVMDSLDLLPEQGFAQFELFTGRRAPRRLMRAEVLKSSPAEERNYPLQPRLDIITHQEP